MLHAQVEGISCSVISAEIISNVGSRKFLLWQMNVFTLCFLSAQLNVDSLVFQK